METSVRTETTLHRTGNRIVVAHGLLLALIVLVVATFHFVFLSGEHLIYPLCLGLAFLLAWSLWSWSRAGAPLSLPVTGSGVLLLMSGLILASGGILGELVYRLGDVREKDFSRLTSRVTQLGEPRGAQA